MFAVSGKVRGQNNTVWNYLRRRPIVLVVVTGAAVALTILVVGLALISTHGNGWPWWLHGVIISLATGLLASFLTHLQVREMKRREARLLAMEQTSHEVCNALQVLVQRMYLHPEHRAQLEDEAIERIRNIMREKLPNVLEIPLKARPSSHLLPSADEKQRKHAAGNTAS